MLTKTKGNMFDWITHTWNPIKGKCSHDCVYCYMKRFPQNPIRLDEKELKSDLGEGNTIFIGSSTDMFAEDVPIEWIKKVLLACNQYPVNTYIFQTKNTARYREFLHLLPPKCFLGTTIESNRSQKAFSKAPDVEERLEFMTEIDNGFITIEPIMDFDLDCFVQMLKMAKPKWVNIGADSKGHGLPEPPMEKVSMLIEELKKFTEVRRKSNLGRLK